MKSSSMHQWLIMILECRISVHQWLTLILECKISIYQWLILVFKCEINVHQWLTMLPECGIIVLISNWSWFSWRRWGSGGVGSSELATHWGLVRRKERRKKEGYILGHLKREKLVYIQLTKIDIWNNSKFSLNILMYLFTFL